MALPPNGDPRRPLHLAIRSTRLLGVLFVLLGLLTPLPTLKLNPHLLELPGPVIASTLIHLLPGLLYLLCSAVLGQGRRPALIASLGLVAVHCVMVAGSLAAFSTLLVAQEQGSFFLFFGLGVMVFAMAALGQLFYHLTKSFKAITYPPLGIPLDMGDASDEPLVRQAA
jgi:ABC-type uncharacterized transport system permease subunit